VIENSADLAERPSGSLCRALFEPGINASSPGTHSNTQSTPTPLDRGTTPRNQSQPTESESDFRSKHGGEADDDPSAKVLARGDDGFSHDLRAAIAGLQDKSAEDTKQVAKAAKHKVKKSNEPRVDGGFGYDLRAAMEGLQDTGAEDAKEVVKEVVVAEAM
jgi:hypothetical protein